MESKILGLQKLVMNGKAIQERVEEQGVQEIPHWQTTR